MNRLHDELNLTRSQSQFLIAAGVPESLVGAALVVETGVHATQLASEVWPNSPLIEWHEASKALRKAIRFANESGNLDATILFKRPASELSIFSTISSWANFHVYSKAHLSLLALLGRGWSINAQKNCAMQENFVSGIRTLNNEHAGRGKRSKEWKLLSNVDLCDIQEVRLVQQRIDPTSKQNEFLRAVVQVLETDAAPASCTKDEKTDSPEESDSQSGSAQEKRLNSSNDYRDPPTDLEVPSSKPVHLDTRRIAARLSAADYSLALAKLGIANRDHLLLGCWRRLNLDSGCQSNFDRGLVANS
jgi:hypothetical protein